MPAGLALPHLKDGLRHGENVAFVRKAVSLPSNLIPTFPREIQIINDLPQAEEDGVPWKVTAVRKTPMWPLWWRRWAEPLPPGCASGGVWFSCSPWAPPRLAGRWAWMDSVALLSRSGLVVATAGGLR